MATTTRNEEESRLLDLRSVSDRLGLALWTVRRWASTHRIPTVKLGSRVFVDARDLDKLIEARRRPARSDVAI